MLKLGEAKKELTDKELAQIAKDAKSAKMNIFAVVQEMYMKNKVVWNDRSEEFKKAFSKFMLVRFFGLHQKLLEPIKYLCENPDIPDCAWHDAVCSFLPSKQLWAEKGLYGRVYKENKDEVKERSCVTEYFSVGTRDAAEICNKLEDSEIERIVKAYEN